MKYLLLIVLLLGSCREPPKTTGVESPEVQTQVVDAFEKLKEENAKLAIQLAEAEKRLNDMSEAGTKWTEEMGTTLTLIGLGIFVLGYLPIPFVSSLRPIGPSILTIGICIGAGPLLLSTFLPEIRPQLATFAWGATWVGLGAIILIVGSRIWFVYRESKKSTKLTNAANNTNDPIKQMKFAAGAAAIDRIIDPKIDKAFKSGRETVETYVLGETK